MTAALFELNYSGCYRVVFWFSSKWMKKILAELTKLFKNYLKVKIMKLYNLLEFREDHASVTLQLDSVCLPLSVVTSFENRFIPNIEFSGPSSIAT